MTDHDRRGFLRTAALGLGATSMGGLLTSACSGRSGSNPPNILVLFTDDQRFDTIGALNCPEISTPNMDRLVRDGTSFTRAHIMGSNSGAVCIPSRAMLMTGASLFHLENNGSSIPEGQVTLPEVLRRNGYRTFFTGKWHSSKAAFARGFTDGGRIFFGGMSNHLKVPVFDFNPSGEYPNENRYLGNEFSSEMFSDDAIEFIENCPAEKPFFACLSYTAPHDPRMAPDAYTDLYPPGSISLPGNFMPEHPFDNGEMRIRDEALAPWPRTPGIVLQHLADYYAMISHVDAQIGRVLDALERSGRADDTCIIFTGDNGLAVGSHGLLGKQNLYDHSVRIPLVISGPGIRRGVRADGLCYLHDIFPTVCDLIDLPVPGSVESSSLAPLLKRRRARVRDSVFFAYKTFQRGVRTDDDWKLILYNVNGRRTTQLFNLADDPLEINNLAGDGEHSNRISELTQLLRDHMRAQSGAVPPFPCPDHSPRRQEYIW